MHIHRIQSLHVHPRIICLSRSMAQPTSRSLAYCMSIFYRPIYLYRPLLNDENFIANCRGRKGFYGCLPGRVFISIPGTFRIGSPAMATPRTLPTSRLRSAALPPTTDIDPNDPRSSIRRQRLRIYANNHLPFRIVSMRLSRR